MILSITVKEITLWNKNLSYVIRNVSITFTFSENAARNNCFQFLLLGPSLCAIVDFLVLDVFNSCNLLSDVRSCRFKAILSEKVPKTVLCVPQST